MRYLKKLAKITLYILTLILLITLLWGCGGKANNGQKVADKEQVNPSEKIVIKFSHVVSEDTPKGLAAQRFADLIGARTGGRVEVQVFPNSTLYKDGEEMTALLSGAVQIIAPSTSKLGDLFPRWQIFDMPYIFQNFDDINSSMSGRIGSALYDDLSRGGIYPLAFWYNGFKQITNSKRPIIHPSDFKGLRFRIMINSTILEEQFLQMGAVPVSLRFNEVYEALSGNSIDGQENTTSNIVSQKFYENQPYLTVSNHGFLGYTVIMNKNFWNSLPPDTRKIITDTFKEVSEWERVQATLINERDMKILSASGKVNIHIQTPEERDEWKKTFAGMEKKLNDIVGPKLSAELIKTAD
ncbi:MAG: DctP family TRAP transporter solute-binding subunit [Desulfocucumaceae bacterium]